MHNQSSITSSYCCEVIFVHNLSLTFPFLIYPMQFVISPFMEDLLEKKTLRDISEMLKTLKQVLTNIAVSSAYCVACCLLECFIGSSGNIQGARGLNQKSFFRLRSPYRNRSLR